MSHPPVAAESESSSLSANHRTIGRRRWLICALVFFATTINYVDRTVLGLLAPMLQVKIGWNEAQYGYIVTSFQVAYALGLLVMGPLIDRVGSRIGYAIAVAIWSVSAMAHSLARSVITFAMARFGLGFGEAGNFPSALKTVAEWFPQRERALATGIFNSGTNIGATFAPLTGTLDRTSPRLAICVSHDRRIQRNLDCLLVKDLPQTSRRREALCSRTGLHPERSVGVGAENSVGEIASPPPSVGIHTREVPDGPRVVVLSLLAAEVFIVRASRHVVWARVAAHCYLQRCDVGQYRRRLAAGEIHESRMDGQSRSQDDDADLRLRGGTGYLRRWHQEFMGCGGGHQSGRSRSSGLVVQLAYVPI